MNIFILQDQTQIFLIKMFMKPELILERNYIRKKENNSDIVIPVPDSGLASAIGYSEASGYPFNLGLFVITMWVDHSFNQNRS